MFLFHHMLPHVVGPALMWEYLGLGDQSAVAEGHLSEESMTGIAWMVLGSASGEPSVDEGLAPFSVFKPRLVDLPYLGTVFVSLAPRGRGARSPLGVLPHH